MPQKFKINPQMTRQLKKDIKTSLAWFIQAFIMPIFRLSAILISNRLINEYKSRWNFVLDITGLVIVIGWLVTFAILNISGTRFIFLWILGVIVGLLLLASVIGWTRKRIRRKYTASDMSGILKKVLKTMDSTAKWYNDENEANVELVTCLKALNIDAEYGYVLTNGRIADARVGNGLVEGKLSPITSEVDRLLGQLLEYTPYGDNLHIVIYGKLSDDAEKRIKKEISNRYLGKVFLVALSNPKRLRVENI